MINLIIKYFKDLFCKHDYFLYYESKYSGHQLWYCKKCFKEKMK